MKKPEDQLVPAAPKLSLPQDVPPSLKRSGAMYAPFTNYFQGNDAAAAKLVTNRLQRSGAPMPSTVGPPAPAVAQPPGMLQRLAPSSAANIAYGTTARPGESVPEMIGRGTTGALGMITAVPEALARSVGTVAAGAKDAAAGVIRGATGAPVAPPQTAIPAPAPTAPPPAQPIARPPSSSGVVASPLDRPGFMPTPTPAAAPAQDTTMLGPLRRAQQPGEVGRSVSGRQLPGSPQVGADGSIVYDQAFMDRNPGLAKEYAQVVTGPLSVSSVGPGVAASMVTGGNMPSGPLTRRPQGFTRADRYDQLDALDRQGREYKQRTLSEKARQQAFFGNKEYAQSLQQEASTAGIAQPPRIEAIRRPDPNADARTAMDASRLAMDAEAQAVDTRARALQLKQAEQMQALTQQLMQGTPEEKQAAAQSLAALQGTKPGQPISIERQVPMGKDQMGTVQFKKETGLYDPSTGQERWFTAGSKQIPQGMTEQSVLAEAQAAIASGKDPAAVAAMLSEYGLTLPN